MVSTTVAPNVKRLDVEQLRINATGVIKNPQVSVFNNANMVILYKNVYVDGIALEAQLYDTDLQYMGTKIVIDTHPFIGSIAINTDSENNHSFFVAWSTLKNSASNWQINLRYYSYDDTDQNWSYSEAQSFPTLKTNKGAFSLAGLNNSVIISTFSTTYSMAITKYTIDQNQIVQNYYQSNTECLKYPKRIISKISDDGFLAVAYSAQSTVHLQHYFIVDGTSVGDTRVSIGVKEAELYLDAQGNQTLLGWRESSIGCFNSDQYYKAQMYQVNNAAVSEISGVIQLSRRYNTILEGITLGDNRQFSAVFQSEDMKVLSIYNNDGEEIYTEEEAAQCPNPDATQSRRFIGADSKTSSNTRAVFATGAYNLVCTAWYLSEARDALQLFKEAGGVIAQFAGSLLDTLDIIGTGISINKQWEWQQGIKDVLPRFSNAVQASSDADIKAKLGSLRTLLSGLLGGIIVSVSSSPNTAVTVNISTCKEKLIPKGIKSSEGGIIHQQSFRYNSPSEGMVLYQKIISGSIYLQLVNVNANPVSETTVVQHPFIHQLDLTNSTIAYSIYNPSQSRYDLTIRPVSSVVIRKTNPQQALSLEEFTNGIYAICEFGSSIAVAYLSNPYTIKIREFNSTSDLNEVAPNSNTEQLIEVGEPYLLKSKWLYDDKYVLVYGTPANHEIHVQVRSLKDESQPDKNLLLCSTTIKESFSHYAIDSYYSVNKATIAIAIQNTYTAKVGEFDKASLYKFDDNCKSLRIDPITKNMQSYMDISTDHTNERLEDIKLIDHTFTIASFTNPTYKIIKVLKNADLFRPDPLKWPNPVYESSINTAYHKVDYIKPMWVPEEIGCEMIDFYTSFIDPLGMSTETFQIVRYEGNYDN